MATKDPRGPLNPQVKVLFDMMNAGKGERVLQPEPLRAGLGALAAFLSAGAPSVPVEQELKIPGPGGTLRARAYWPGEIQKGPYPALVYFHGGGYVAMTPETHEKLCKELCLGIGAVVICVDYRLSPEFKYPHPLEDCLATWRWVRENARDLGIDTNRMLAGGDSAGGNATAAVTLRLKAAGEPLPRAALLLCPWLDMALDTASYRAFSPGDGVLDDDIMTYFRDSYVKKSDWKDPFASPLRADLADFPPTLVVVGAIDPLRDDGIEFAKKLLSSGRSVSLLNYAGMPHDFMLFPGIDDGARSVAEIARYARGALR